MYRRLVLEQLEEKRLCATLGCCLHTDTNNDGYVDAADVIGPINWLNLDQNYNSDYDVNKDDSVSPLDPLLVINYINVNGPNPAVQLFDAEFLPTQPIQANVNRIFSRLNYNTPSGCEEIVPLTLIVNSIKDNNGAMWTESMTVPDFTLTTPFEILSPTKHEEDGLIYYEANARLSGNGLIDFSGVLGPAGETVYVSAFWQDSSGEKMAISQSFPINAPLIQFSFATPSTVSLGDSDIIDVKYRVPEGCTVDVYPTFTVRNMVQIPGTFPDAIYTEMADIWAYTLETPSGTLREGSIVGGGVRSSQFRMTQLSGSGTLTLRGNVQPGNELLQVSVTWLLQFDGGSRFSTPQVYQQIVFSDLIQVI